MIPRMKVWRHRDGGFVCQVWGERWKLEFSFGRHHRDKWGVGKPLVLTLTTWPREEA